MSSPIAYVALQQFCAEDERPRQVLLDAGFEVRENTLGHRLRREEMLSEIGEADAVLAGIEPYDCALMSGLPRLRCISRCGVGTDSIDLDAAKRHGIVVYRTKDEVIESVAEMSVAMILALARQLPIYASNAREGLWIRRTGFLLSEWTIGILGFGSIGRAVERCLRPLGPRVLVSDPNVEAANLPEGVVRCEQSLLLAESDLISLHADRRKSEGPLIGPMEFMKMKSGSYLVNTARGHLVDERALYDALKSGHIAGCALDVFEKEPYTGGLMALPQVLCTPHVSTLTRASRKAMELRCAQNAADWWLAQQSKAAETVIKK